LVRKIREFIISGASSIWADDDDVPRGSAVDEFGRVTFSEALIVFEGIAGYKFAAACRDFLFNALT